MSRPNQSIPSKTLIHLVKQRPVIWNGICSNGGTTRAEAWKEIFEALVPTYRSLCEHSQKVLGHKITKRWLKIRDTYKKTQKKQKNYYHAHLLSFLDGKQTKEQPQDSDSYGENDNKAMKIDETDNFDGDDKSSTNSSFLDFESPDQKTKLTDQERTQSDNEQMDKESNHSFVDILSTMSREQDEDIAFFSSALPTVKLLPHNLKMEFRIEMMKLLQRLTEKANDGPKEVLSS